MYFNVGKVEEGGAALRLANWRWEGLEEGGGRWEEGGGREVGRD